MSVTNPDSADWMRPLGQTGLQVSAIVAGGGPLGGMPDLFGYDVSADQGVAVVEAILDSPIRMIDTSNGYSDGKSETRIGQAIGRANPVPDGFLVATKVDPRDGDFSGRRIRDSIRESQDRLGFERLPLVHLHDPEFHPAAGLDEPGGAVEALVSLRDEGVIGHLGIAAGHTPTIHRFLDLEVFEVVLTHSRLTMLDRGADDLVDRARGAGIGVMNAAVLGGGILASRTAKPLYGFRPALPAILEASRALHDLAEELEVSLPDAAVQHSVRDRRVDATIVGFSKPARVTSLLRALSSTVPDTFWERAHELLPDPRVWLDAPSHQ